MSFRIAKSVLCFSYGDQLISSSTTSVKVLYLYRYSALYYAVNENNSDIMKVLLEYRPTLESPNSYQDPLYTACRYGKTEIVNMLLSAGSYVCSILSDFKPMFNHVQYMYMYTFIKHVWINLRHNSCIYSHLAILILKSYLVDLI